MVGVDNTVYLIDLGLVQRFRDPITGIHTSLTNSLDLIGTIRYTSINSHLEVQQSQQDDLESLAYTILYMLQRKLPWQGMRLPPNADRRAAVLRKKQEIHHSTIVRDIPSPITTFLHYTQSLSFEAHYNYLESLLQCLCQ